jgi:penicillin-binding protein 1A
VEHLINMLRGAVDQGTGQALRTQFGVRADVAGKTGTTQKNTDGWFILMHPRLVTGAWVGFNDSRVTMRSDYWGEGAHNALLVVGDFFRQALAARLIDGGVEFPFERPRDSIWDDYLDAAREWFGGIFKGWLLGDRARPPLPQRETPRPEQREQRELERQVTKERLLEILRQKQEQRRQENRERE